MIRYFSGKSIGFAFFALMLSTFMTTPYIAHAELNQAYQNCLCTCGCESIGSNCNAVSCTFNTTDYNASPSCAEASNGPCKCEGFGCFRAQIVTSGDCHDSCQVHLTSDSCAQLKTDYNAARASYLKKLNTYQDLTNFEYRLIANIHTNTMKLGTAFIAKNLTDTPSGKISNIAADIITDIINQELQGDTLNPIEVQAKMIRAYKMAEDKRALLRAEQNAKMSNLKTISGSMDKFDCSYNSSESIPMLQDVKLNDISDETPRDLKIKALNRLGVINGYDDGTYQPTKKINRAEFLKILVGSAYPDEVVSGGENCFSDVRNDWYSKYVCLAKDKGIVEGYEDGSFKPSQEINAVEALKIIMETLHKDKIVDKDGEWWRKYWDAAESMDVVTDDIEDQGEHIDRGQMAEMVYNAMSEDISTMKIVAEDKVVNVDVNTLVQNNDKVPVDSEQDNNEEDSEEEDNVVHEKLTNSLTKTGEYTIYYPDRWTLNEANDTHKIFTKGDMEISITESGYTYERIKELIKEDYMKLQDAFIDEDETDAGGDKVYSLTVSYVKDGTDFYGQKIVIPNVNEKNYIWEIKTPLSDIAYSSTVIIDMLDAWEIVI